jgi:hypothetical protein
MYASILQRDVGHYDIYDGVRRAFAIRGEYGNVYVRDERRLDCDIKSFEDLDSAFLWCLGEMLAYKKDDKNGT